MSKRKRKAQTQKGRNEEMMRAFQELRRSSAAQPHKNKARYNRKRKHSSQDW